VTTKLDALAEQLNERAKSLQTVASEAQKKALSDELQELKARQMFGKHEQSVLDEIERKRKVAAYGMCLDDTRTQAISMKSTAVTKVAVTQQLKKTFKDELKNLKFRHVEVELTEAGGESGSLYHKLILTRAPGVDLPKVVSEGEARCLSIAAFFAELSTADDPSAILFDDPVSSFDYNWRESVAERLVEEARTRQVIVFTHDIVFLLLLQQYADKRGVGRLDQHVRQLQIGAGVCEAELPWIALPVKKRVGFLKTLW
jgi:energy-coupling factor transporter ATP-binding protein EcfA2